jgi:hypothetical protein
MGIGVGVARHEGRMGIGDWGKSKVNLLLNFQTTNFQGA